MYAVTELYPNVEVGNAVHEYCINHSTPVPKHIDQHRNDTIEWCAKTGSDANMMINTLEAQFLIFFARAQGVKRVLEIGMFTGYSALVWAEALKDEPEADIICLDIPGQSTDFAKEVFVKTGADKVVKVIEGNAEISIDSLAGQTFDLVFIDANKNGYITYFKKVLELNLLAPKGIIIADNALRCGLVADSSERNPAAKVEGQRGNYKFLDQFNKVVRDDPRVEQVLLPAFDGLNFIRLK